MFLCGRYEGIDERVREALATEEISIGDYVLSGGEVPALAVIDAVARLVPGVVGDDQSVEADSFTRGLLDYPHYTRPAEFEGRKVPDVLVSGHHGEIRRWRRETALRRTVERRPDLLARRGARCRRTRVVEKEQVMTAMELVEKAQLTERPRIKAGDTVKVHVRVKEGDKERIQIFEGVVIGLRRGGNRATFTVRKVSFSQGVERIFPLHSPTISKVEIVRSAKVRRAKLYFLRDLKGKAARMKEVKKTSLSALRSACQVRCSAEGLRAPQHRKRLHRYGFVAVAGVDEVGRGCLAGPVMAGAVILHPERRIDGLADSKACTAAAARPALRRDLPQERRVGGRVRRPRRNRSHQHPPGHPAGHAARRAGAGAAARCSFGRCLSNSVIADGAARRDRRRSARVGHSGGVDCGQSDAGSIDAGPARR